MKTRLFVCFFVFAAALFFTNHARAQMSDTEKKAAARAAYQEGVKLQDEGKFEDALRRFESAQKLFDAPTHLLHIAECQALTGRLVESSETYETLARKTLPPGAPEAFTQAQQQGQAELPPLRARIPSLRVTTKPGPQQLQNLQVNVNGVNMPNELLGIARPLNPGVYRFSAQAVGWSTPQSIDVPLAEKEQKSIELTLVQGSTGAVLVAPPPPPPPYGSTVVPEKPKATAATGPTSSGLILGVRGGGVIPGGSYREGGKLNDSVKAGGSFGLDGYLRLAKMLLLGATFDYGVLGTPSTIQGVSGTFNTSAHTTYVGLNLGIVPNIDRVSFIGDLGLGSRSLTASVSGTNLATGQFVNGESSASGLEFMLGAGLSIPAGPIRIVPRANLGVGSFGSEKITGAGNQSREGDIPSADRATHTFIFLGVALYYSLNFGAKPEAQ
jgi:hypothetical protein